MAEPQQDQQAESSAKSAAKMNIFTKIVRPELLGKTPLDKNVTFAVKANIGCGYPASASTPSLRDWVPKDYSPVVRSLVDSGHQIVAITNMHELAFGITSENPARYGDVDNPRKSGYIAGGSSGGSAAAVAINAVSFALGTDTGGSMRIPAALCGVVGYRPTIGLYDASVVCPLSSTTDTIGIFAHHVSTVQKVHKIIIPSYSPAARLLVGARIGVPRQYFYCTLDSEVSRVTEAALQALKESGVELVEVDFPAELADLLGACFDLVTYESYRLIPKYLKDQQAPISFDELCKQVGDPVVKDAIVNANRISDERYHQCQQEAEKIRKFYNDYFKENTLDAFVSPTTILPAVKKPSPPTLKVCGQEFPTMVAYTLNTFPQAIAGVPCISLPSGLSSDGLPIGLEVVAPRGMDSSLLDLAAAMQTVLPSLPQLSFSDFKDRI